MEFDHNLLFNFLPIFGTILLILVTFTTVFQRLKLRWPVKVNCWFCNNNTKIWRQELEWWLCPTCEQYNGFTKNGDYMYSIPEQYKTASPSSKRYCTENQSKATETVKNNLCSKCNTQESLKLLKLSNFEPISEKNYEYEVNEFKHELEKKYPLCTNCKSTVENVLHKQALWLAQCKMLLFKQKPISTILNNAKYSESMFRIISTILDSLVAYNNDLLILPIAGLFFQLCACWVTPAKRRSSDVLLSFLWICIALLVPFKDLKLLKNHFRNVWFSVEFVTQYHVIMLFAFIIGFINVKPPTHKKKLNKNISFKKIETSFRDSTISDTSTIIHDSLGFDSKVTDSLSHTMTNSQVNNNTFNGFTPMSMENTATNKSAISHSPVTTQESHTLSKSFNSNVYMNHINNASESIPWNDSLHNLSTLSLGDDLPKYSIKSPKMFERKIYNTRSPDLFKKFNGSTRKSILSPPKLKSVMQTSWVAGGYWQEGIEAPSLSRSSSQSSGFGSAGSNFGPSREPSVHEFDQCSVTSDATQSCYNSRPTSQISGGILGPQNIQFAFTEPKTPVLSQTLKHTPNYALSSQPLLLPQNYQQNHSKYAEPPVQGQRMNVSDIKNPSEMQLYPSHTTIVTSPVWLPALLCGSLVLNIIVLCTTLLR